jgi:UPF0716 protein FxsA
MFRLLSLVWIILELVVFFWVAHMIGLGWALLLIVLSSLAGGVLMRRFGFANLQKAQIKMMQGQSPTREMLNGVAIVLGGIFMIIPGFISSIIGLFLLVPGLRNPIANWILSKSSFSMMQATAFTQQAAPNKPAQGPEIIEGEQGRTIEGEAWKSHDEH